MYDRFHATIAQLATQHSRYSLHNYKFAHTWGFVSVVSTLTPAWLPRREHAQHCRPAVGDESNSQMFKGDRRISSGVQKSSSVDYASL